MADPVPPRDVPMLAPRGRGTLPVVREVHAALRAVGAADASTWPDRLARREPVAGDRGWLLRQTEIVARVVATAQSRPGARNGATARAQPEAREDGTAQARPEAEEDGTAQAQPAHPTAICRAS